MRACGIINIKLGRVGGFAEAKQVHDVAQAAGIPVWCGGMLEAGIGRAHNIALATLPNFVLPGDVSASKRYWKRDIIQPPVETTPQGTIEIRDAPGFGYEIDHDYLIGQHHGAARRLSRLTCLRFSLLRDNRNYRYTWIGQVVSEIGDHFNNIAVFSLALATYQSGLVVSGSDALARHSGHPGRADGGRRARPARPQAGHDRERRHPRRAGARLHPHGASRTQLAAVRSQRAADVGVAVLHQRARGHSAHHRHARGTAHRQLADPDHRSGPRWPSARSWAAPASCSSATKWAFVVNSLSFLVSALCISRLFLPGRGFRPRAHGAHRSGRRPAVARISRKDCATCAACR